MWAKRPSNFLCNHKIFVAKQRVDCHKQNVNIATTLRRMSYRDRKEFKHIRGAVILNFISHRLKNPYFTSAVPVKTENAREGNCISRFTSSLSAVNRRCRVVYKTRIARVPKERPTIKTSCPVMRHQALAFQPKGLVKLLPSLCKIKCKWIKSIVRDSM